MNEQSKSIDLRSVALDILTEVTQNGGYLNQLLRQVLDKYAYLDRRDRAFISRLCIGTVERMITLDACIDRVSKVPVRKMKPFIRNLLRISTYQIYEMDSVREYAICDEAVKLAKKRKFTPLSGFVNGVLRTLIRERDRAVEEDLSIRTSPALMYRKLLPDVSDAVIYGLPEFIFRRLKEAYPDRVLTICDAFMAHNELPTSVHLLRGVRKNAADDVTDLVSRGVLKVHPCEQNASSEANMFLCPHLDVLMEEPLWKEGCFMVQDISSAVVGRMLSLKKGDRILELCASPGGKTLHAADLLSVIDPDMHPVISCDISAQKVSRIEENLMLHHMNGRVRTCIWDATKPGLLSQLDVPPFDIVIADVPCSGLGMLGNKPDIRHRLKEEDLSELQDIQRKILTQAADLVRPGGVLLYSTCTLNPGENAKQMQWFYEHFPFEEDPESAAKLKAALGGTYEGYRERFGFSLLPGEYPGEGFYLCRSVKKH